MSTSEVKKIRWTNPGPNPVRFVVHDVKNRPTRIELQVGEACEIDEVYSSALLHVRCEPPHAECVGGKCVRLQDAGEGSVVSGGLCPSLVFEGQKFAAWVCPPPTPKRPHPPAVVAAVSGLGSSEWKENERVRLEFEKGQ